MALDRLTEDMNFVRNMGDDPKRDDGLSTQEFKSIFDKAGLLIQDFINNKLIPYIEKHNVGLPLAGGTMEGPINMNGQRLTGLNAPTADDEAATKGFVTEATKDFATETYVNDKVKTAAPRNLLDNSDFTNLIAQAGILGMHGATKYFADRWKVEGSSITYDASTRLITFAENTQSILTQKVSKDISGKTVTLAIKASNVSGNVYLSVLAGTNMRTFWDDSEFFDREEFRCQCKGKYCNGFPVEPEEELVRVCNEIRRRLGVPVSIVDSGGSGVRCHRHNAAVGGVGNSNHLYGKAADLHSGKSPQEMYRVAETVLGNTGELGLYDWGIHVGVNCTYSRF